MFVQLLVITMIMYQASVSEACTGYSPNVSYVVMTAHMMTMSGQRLKHARKN